MAPSYMERFVVEVQKQEKEEAQAIIDNFKVNWILTKNIGTKKVIKH